MSPTKQQMDSLLNIVDNYRIPLYFDAAFILKKLSLNACMKHEK